MMMMLEMEAGVVQLSCLGGLGGEGGLACDEKRCPSSEGVNRIGLD